MHAAPRSPYGKGCDSGAYAGNHSASGAAQAHQPEPAPRLAALQSTVEGLERENARLREGLSRPASAGTAASNGARKHSLHALPYIVLYCPIPPYIMPTLYD